MREEVGSYRGARVSRWARLSRKACKTPFSSGSLVPFLALGERKEGVSGQGRGKDELHRAGGRCCVPGTVPLTPRLYRESWCFLNLRQGLGWLQPSLKAFTSIDAIWEVSGGTRG